ncbi:hypothetical protein CTI12_AA073220 [Artemisia annua]|uniref:Hydroxyproline-rich glycoprotein family protein n=1 Tax=Artemisia annua TaxID=35608 RepID=A0A2U1Q4Z8_ARTAN|nr:hypothetical protein CTI12_AA073220 [Artemisia annua]
MASTKLIIFTLFAALIFLSILEATMGRRLLAYPGPGFPGFPTFPTPLPPFPPQLLPPPGTPFPNFPFPPFAGSFTSPAIGATRP